MGEQRIKGQEVEILIILNGAVQETITDVRSFEFVPKFELKEEGYLGEKTNRQDEQYNGVRGRMEIHHENDDIFNLINSIKNRATRRTPGVKVNIKATLNYPNGDRPRILIPDVSFGEMPVGFGSRSDYGTVSIDFAAEDYDII